MKNQRLGLAFIPMPEGTAGPPILRVVAWPLAGGEQYPRPYTNGAFLTLQEYHPRQLELQVRQLQSELDEVVAEAKQKYEAWERGVVGQLGKRGD